jgi:hypothetical protein
MKVKSNGKRKGHALTDPEDGANMASRKRALDFIVALHPLQNRHRLFSANAQDSKSNHDLRSTMA